MSQLFFKTCFQDAIREGRKSTTIRRWPASGAPLKAGQPAWAPGVGWLEIDTVEPIDLNALGDGDARADGFDSAPSLRDALLSLYPQHATDGKVWYRVH